MLRYFGTIDENAFQQQTKAELERKSECTPSRITIKRGPGRPKKRKAQQDVCNATPMAASDDTTATVLHSQVESDESSAKATHIDWFASPFIHDIIAAVGHFRSARVAVESLQKRFPRLPTESEGRFDRLRESTIRTWFDDEWKLRERFACLAKPEKGGSTSAIGEELEEKIIHQLRLLRDAGQAVSATIIRMVVIAIVRNEKKDDVLKKHSISLRWCRHFVATKLGWRFRRTTTSSCLPLHWKDDGIVMLKRTAVRIDEINSTNSVRNSFHRSLLINFDQTGVHLVPKSNYTYAAKGSKCVATVGNDDRR
jgi:hypothetical protein